MPLRLSGANSSSVKGAFFSVLGIVLTAAILVLSVFALTFVLTIGACAALVGLIWWKLSGKKRFIVASNGVFNTQNSNQPPQSSGERPGTDPRDIWRNRNHVSPRQPLHGHIIEGEFMQVDCPDNRNSTDSRFD
jgi:hypothetical protein